MRPPGKVRLGGRVRCADTAEALCASVGPPEDVVDTVDGAVFSTYRGRDQRSM